MCYWRHQARVSLFAIQVNQRLWRITIANSDKTFVFKAGSLEETTNWVVKIRNAIDKSEGKGKNYSYLAHYPRFWRVFCKIFRKIMKVIVNSNERQKQEIWSCLEGLKIVQWCKELSLEINLVFNQITQTILLLFCLISKDRSCFSRRMEGLELGFVRGVALWPKSGLANTTCI